ncbi:MAG TPA: hypothetical protein VE591_07620 [Candidatus Acidoferrum sp.]|nr:hypothetical protein [Candidatus Acidoferrum sp.]
MIGNAAAASHLAELEARYEGHLAALRSRAEEFHERLAGEGAVLKQQLTPAPYVADTPLVAPGEIPLGPDA